MGGTINVAAKPELMNWPQASLPSLARKRQILRFQSDGVMCYENLVMRHGSTVGGTVVSQFR